MSGTFKVFFFLFDLENTTKNNSLIVKTLNAQLLPILKKLEDKHFYYQHRV